MPTNQRLERVFADASFFIAAINRRDQYHAIARQFDVALRQVDELWTTDAVLMEVAATIATPPLRMLAIDIWDKFHGGDSRCFSAEASGENLADAVMLFRARADKAWSLTDCLSFVVMERKALVEALTADQHFVQAGFRAMLLG